MISIFFHHLPAQKNPIDIPLQLMAIKKDHLLILLKNQCLSMSILIIPSLPMFTPPKLTYGPCQTEDYFPLKIHDFKSLCENLLEGETQ
jgi:hypothetical protein